MTDDNPRKVLDKLDQMYIIYLFHDLQFEIVIHQVPANSNINPVEELLERLYWVPFIKTLSSPTLSSFTYYFNNF